MKYELTPLRKAVAIAGGQALLARGIGTKQQNVWKWLQKGGKVPAEFAAPIERVTGITKHELRPDIFEASQ
jgi:DNA-binding transcriptional regulator YdaS (Cro superfamily)